MLIEMTICTAGGEPLTVALYADYVPFQHIRELREEGYALIIATPTREYRLEPTTIHAIIS